MNLQDTGIDIVVLNCNNDGYIQTCLQGIINNTPAPYNLIVVDQNSQDGSREWLIEKRITSHLVLNKMNVGTAEGRNQGIRAGKYPWIAFIDSDIEIQDKEWVDKMWNYTIDHHIGFIEGHCFYKNWTDKARAWMAFSLVRRKCLNEIGIFDTNFFICEEYEFLVRLNWNKFWQKAMCPDLNVCHLDGKTKVEGVLKNKFNEYKEEASLLLYKKYNEDFIKKMLDDIKSLDNAT